MRRLLKWLVISLGIAALVRKLRSRRAAPEQATEPAVEATPADDPADELRRKLAETREPEAATAPEDASPEGSVEERRADVHDQGRATLEEMRSAGEDE
jgi:hypothetical protein